MLPLCCPDDATTFKMMMNSVPDVTLTYSDDNAYSSVNPQQQQHPLEDSIPYFLNSLSAKIENRQGLSDVPLEVLQGCLKPLLNILERIDAESFLELDRTSRNEAGAVVEKG